MKCAAIVLFGFAATALFSCVAPSGESPPAPARLSAALPATLPASGDAAADLVASFYRVLLQEEPPTRQQELELFPADSQMRYFLASPRDQLKKAGLDLELRRRLKERGLAAGPVVLTYFREHKDWFLPVPMSSPDNIMISSRFKIIRSLVKARRGEQDDGNGFVLVVVSDSEKRGVTRGPRNIVFTVKGGKIGPYSIYLDGFDGQTAGSRLAEELARGMGPWIDQ